MSDRPTKRAHRFNVSFSESAWATLVLLGERKGKSMSEVLRDAIALEKWFQDTIESGARIMVEDSAGRIREVIPR
jgi:hypothetical protein